MGGVNHAGDEPPAGVGEDMALAPLNQLAGVEPARAAAFRGFHRLAVDHTGGRAGLSALGLARAHEQLVVDPVQRRLGAPSVEVLQDRDGAPPLLASIRWAFPWLRHVFADGAYAGPKLGKALEKISQWTLEIVKRSDDVTGFKVLPRRWVVERTFAWLGRNRRLAKDFEATIASAEAWLMIASIQLLTRRIARL